jgi:hypothetical protein
MFAVLAESKVFLDQGGRSWFPTIRSITNKLVWFHHVKFAVHEQNTLFGLFSTSRSPDFPDVPRSRKFPRWLPFNEHLYIIECPRFRNRISSISSRAEMTALRWLALRCRAPIQDRLHKARVVVVFCSQVRFSLSLFPRSHTTQHTHACTAVSAPDLFFLPPLHHKYKIFIIRGQVLDHVSICDFVRLSEAWNKVASAKTTVSIVFALVSFLLIVLTWKLEVNMESWRSSS